MDLSLVQLCRAANHPADDTSAVGGALAAGPVQITAITVGECLPKLLAPYTGALDTDAATQYQLSYIVNRNVGETVGNPRVHLRNGIKQLAAADRIRFVSTAVGDGATRHVQIWGEVGGTLVSEQVTLAGTTPVSSVQIFTRVFRVLLRETSSGALVNAVGRINCTAFTDSAAVGSFFPGVNALTAEIALGSAAAKGNLGTWTNRRTAPAGISFSLPLDDAAPLSLPADLAGGEACGVYWRETVQPGMPRTNLYLDFMIVVEV